MISGKKITLKAKKSTVFDKTKNSSLVYINRSLNFSMLTSLYVVLNDM